MYSITCYNTKATIAVTLVVLLFVSSQTSAFTFVSSPSPKQVVLSNSSSTSSTRLNIFGDALKNAFGNDESLGKAQNAGLTNGPKENDNVTLNGKKVKAVVGQKVSVVAAQNRVKINYNCRNGDCGTCMIKMNGRNVKACQMSIPSGKCNIETL